MGTKFKDEYYLDAQFKNWKVIGFDKENPELCICECQCENRTVKKFSRGYLRQGYHRKDCGCSKRNLPIKKRPKAAPRYSYGIYYREERDTYMLQVRHSKDIVYQTQYKDKTILTGFADRIVAALQDDLPIEPIKKELAATRRQDKWRSKVYGYIEKDSYVQFSIENHTLSFDLADFEKIKAALPSLFFTKTGRARLVTNEGQKLSVQEYLFGPDEQYVEFNFIDGDRLNFRRTNILAVRIEDDPMVGKRFGSWEILQLDPVNKNRYICKCQCHRETVRSVQKRYLLNNKSRGCCSGCDTSLVRKERYISGVFKSKRRLYDSWVVRIYADTNLCFSQEVYDEDFAKWLYENVNDSINAGQSPDHYLDIVKEHQSQLLKRQVISVRNNHSLNWHCSDDESTVFITVKHLGVVYTVAMDSEDFHRLNMQNAHLYIWRNDVTVRLNIPNRYVFLKRLIMGVSERTPYVQFKDGDFLNLRKDNLYIGGRKKRVDIERSELMNDSYRYSDRRYQPALDYTASIGEENAIFLLKVLFLRAEVSKIAKAKLNAVICAMAE